MTYTIKIPETLRKRMDERATELGLTTASFIKQAVSRELERDSHA